MLLGYMVLGVLRHTVVLGRGGLALLTLVTLVAAHTTTKTKQYIQPSTHPFIFWNINTFRWL